jgi:hypothetical protein
MTYYNQEREPEVRPMHPKKTSKKTIIMAVVMFVLVAIIVLCSWAAFHYRSQYNNLKENPEIITQEENAILIASVGSLIELPADEEPTIATVMDKDKLADQPFFTSAENGDKVLLYVSAKKAILYRPSTNKVVEVAPIFTDTTGTSTTTTQ